MSYSEVKNLLQSGLSREIIEAGLACGIPVESIEEAYYGFYPDDESFARELAESIEAIDQKASWPHTCIDWNQAAEELMQDFVEDSGHYFSNTY